MNVDKIRNLTDIELNHQQRELADQLFKMKFQLKMGQTESLKKIRELKKRHRAVQNTVIRQKQIKLRAMERPSPRARQHRHEEEGGHEEGCNGEKSKPWPKRRRQNSNETAAGFGGKTLIGKVVSTKMAKTIVVEVRRQKAHPFYKRVVARSKKFYAHDEDKTAHVGDFVKIEAGRVRCPSSSGGG